MNHTILSYISIIARVQHLVPFYKKKSPKKPTEAQIPLNFFLILQLSPNKNKQNFATVYYEITELRRYQTKRAKPKKRAAPTKEEGLSFIWQTSFFSAEFH